MDSQEDSLNSARLREFKEYLLKFGDDFEEASQPVTVDDSDGDVDSNLYKNVDETLHGILKVGRHAETLVHASASGQSRWNTFRQRFAKQTANLRISQCTKTARQAHIPTSKSRRDWRKRSRVDLTRMPGSTPPRSGEGAQAETQPYPEWVYEEYVTKAIESSQPSNDRDGHPTDKTSAQPDQMADQHENDVQIDLVTGFQQSQPGPDGNNSDGVDSSEDRNNDAFSSSPGTVDILSGTGFSQQAKTPVSHWAKQMGYDGPHSEATTPALPVNPFENATTTGTVMGLSQVFQATQAITPLRPKLVSDPLTERPSPDIYNQQRRPAPAFISSPLQNFKTSSDRPLAKSPRNPQQERENLSRKGRSSSANPKDLDDLSEDDSGTSLSPVIRARIRRREEVEAIRKSLDFKVILPERETKAEITRGRRKKGGVQKTEHGQLSRKPQAEPYSQSEKRTAQVEDTETTSDEDEISERVQPAGNVTTTIVPGGHGRESPGVTKSSDGVQVPMTTTRQIWRSGTRRSLEDSPLSLVPQNPRNHGATDSPKPQSHLSAITSSDPGNSVIVQGTPVGDAVKSQQPPIQGNRKGNGASLAPHSIIRSSAELASSNSESQSTIVQAEPNNRPNVHFTFETVENLSAPEAVVNSGEVVASSVTGKQGPRPQAEGVEVTAHDPDIEASEDRVDNDSNPINSQRGIQLRPNSAGPGRREDSSPGGHSPVPASTNHSHTRSQRVPKGRLSEGGAMSPRNQTSLNTSIVIPETSPAGGSWPLSPISGSSTGGIHSFPAPSRARENSLGNMATTARGDESLPDTTYGSERSTARPAAAISAEPKLLEKQSMTALGQRNENQDRASSVQIQRSSEAHDHSETASTNYASEDESVNSSPLYHFKKRRKGYNGNSAPAVPQQPRLPLVSNVPKPVDETTASSGSGDITAESRTTNAKKKARPSEPLISHKHRTEISKSGGASALTLKSPEHMEGQRGSSDNGRRPVGSDSPTSTHQVRHSRPELDTNHVPAGRGSEEDVPPVQETEGLSHGPSDTSLTHPSRVFALFKGVKMAYYPATCLSSVSSNECKVRFDDGNTSILDSSHVCSLDLKQDDVVKVDLPNMRQKNYTIVGFRTEEDHTVATQPQDSGQYPRTDIHGHSIVVLKVKSGGRLSSAGPTSNDDTVSVPLGTLYIVLSNWLKYKDRIHTHPLQGETETRSHTPTRPISAPLTPSSRSHRVKSATPRHGATMPDRPISELFKNMAFAVSYGDSEVDKKLIIKHITMNGGKILEDGPNELFDMDPANAARGRAHIDISGSQTHNLELKSQWERTGFVCVLSDQHTRRAKYIEALALGLPCLAGRWIEDCVRQNAIISWEPYILPSGESTYLRKAVRNRSIQYYPAETARLAMTIQSRPKLLEGKSVLILRSGETAESRKTFFFLIHALGPSRIDRVANVEAANTTLTESLSNGHTWDFLYTGTQRVNSNDIRVRTISAGMKRKRGFNERLRSEEDGMSNEPTRIIDNEFLIQSLILGRLLEE